MCGLWGGVTGLLWGVHGETQAEQILPATHWRERRRNRLLRFMQEQRGMETDIEKVFKMKPKIAKALISTLSPREVDVVALIAIGWSRTMIADSLGITLRTVNEHVASATKKLGLPPHGFARVWFCAACGEG